MEFIKEMEELRKEIARKRKKLADLRILAEKVTNAPCGMPGAPIKNPHRKEDVYAELAYISSEISMDVDKLGEMEAKLYRNLLKLPDMRYLKILEGRYIDCMSWHNLSEYLGYSKRYLIKLHNKAMDSLKIF